MRKTTSELLDYDREYIIDELVKRYSSSFCDTWKIEDFFCQKLEQNTYLVTYLLHQEQRLSRRATLWKNMDGVWKIFYHQGTLISSN